MSLGCRYLRDQDSRRMQSPFSGLIVLATGDCSPKQFAGGAPSMTTLKTVTPTRSRNTTVVSIYYRTSTNKHADYAKQFEMQSSKPKILKQLSSTTCARQDSLSAVYACHANAVEDTPSRQWIVSRILDTIRYSALKVQSYMKVFWDVRINFCPDSYGKCQF